MAASRIFELPLADFRGVALCIAAVDAAKTGRLSVVLLHADPRHDLPLFEADDDRNAIAEWRWWGSALALPLLIERADGAILAAVRRLGAVEVSRPYPRRRRPFLAGRRPRFLTRRRTGRLSLVPFVHRDERELTFAG